MTYEMLAYDILNIICSVFLFPLVFFVIPFAVITTGSIIGFCFMTKAERNKRAFYKRIEANNRRLVREYEASLNGVIAQSN